MKGNVGKLIGLRRSPYGEELYDYPFLDHIYNLKCNEGSNYIKLDYYLKSKSKN